MCSFCVIALETPRTMAVSASELGETSEKAYIN